VLVAGEIAPGAYSADLPRAVEKGLRAGKWGRRSYGLGFFFSSVSTTVLRLLRVIDLHRSGCR